MPSANKPIKTFRHRAISASVFANETTVDGQPVTFHKVNLQRAFKQGAEFKHNASFSRDEIPVVRLVSQRAWEFVLELEASAGKSPEQDDYFA